MEKRTGDGWDLLDPDVYDLLAARGGTGNMADNLDQIRNYLETLPYPESLPAMASADWVEIAGPDGDPLRLQVIRPTTETGGPVIVYFHSGGMVMGSARSSYPVATFLAHHSGATVVNVDYRLAPEHPIPAQAEDGYAALCWVAENAAELGVDAHRIATFGDSAGGTLAAAIPLMSRDRGGPRVFAQVIAYGGCDFDLAAGSVREFAFAPGLDFENVTSLKRLAGTAEAHESPYAVPSLARDLSGLPQAIVITGEVDPIRDWSERYARLLRDARVQVTMTRYPGLHHGFLMRVDDLARARLAMAETGALLRAKFANPLPWA